MQYYEDDKNKIQADIAHRLGKVSLQYSAFCLRLPSDEDFAATLDICILQNLLTNCIELLREMLNAEKKEEKNRCFKILLEADPPWGLSKSMVEKNTFSTKDLSVEDFLRHLRNALSHPTPTKSDTDYPSTGYTAIYNLGQVSQYIFVTSPDARENKPMTWDTIEDVNVHFSQSGGKPRNVDIKDFKGKFVLCKDNKRFARIFIARMNPKQVHSLVLGLSNQLAQPIQKYWNGHTIVKLVA